ncbi:glycosyltransferase family 4 protein [Gramella sp. MT6]|uniref:glycosyltransferase family 4 protein n=1 Tax=Gramella sp. MT6 TaxID=2705471 RepID=UPI001C5D35A3|nr:glycosyltransferase family 4 protein [Gramella sp. MT6]QYA25790.1 glycosyltransferase family 4 protein [Gramella sp. MT6]
MKILHISGHTSWGGSEQQLFNTIEELEKYDVQQMAFCFLDTPTHIALKKTRTEIFAIEKVKPHKSEYLRFLANIVRNNKVDIIHLHTSDALTGFVLCDLIYSLNVATVYSRKHVRNKSSFLSKLKYNYRNIDSIICVSDYVKDHFSKVLNDTARQKLTVIRDGVKQSNSDIEEEYSLRKKLNISEDKVLIGNIANHTKAKDLKTLIKAVSYLVHELNYRNFKLVQIGEFSKRTPEYKKEVESERIEEYLSFTGFLENASILIPEFDVFAMSSEREGGPSSVIESFFYKTPVVSTRVGIIEETIENGKNGFSVEVGDYKDLAEGIKKLAESPELRNEFSEKSHKMFFENFTTQSLGKNTYEAYASLL